MSWEGFAELAVLTLLMLIVVAAGLITAVGWANSANERRKNKRK